MGTATIVLVFGARFILRVYGGSYIAHTVVLFQLLSLTLLPFCIETIAFSLDRIAGKPIRATLSQLAIAVLTLGGSWLLFGRLGLNAVGVACLGADIAVALVRLPTVLAALRRAARCDSAAGQCTPAGRSAGFSPLPPALAPALQSRGATRAVTGQQGRARTHQRPPAGPRRPGHRGAQRRPPQQGPAPARPQRPAPARHRSKARPSPAAAGTRAASCKRARGVHVPACTGRRRVSPVGQGLISPGPPRARTYLSARRTASATLTCCSRVICG